MGKEVFQGYQGGRQTQNAEGRDGKQDQEQNEGKHVRNDRRLFGIVDGAKIYVEGGKTAWTTKAEWL